MDGFRKCLEKEFSSIYIFNLRGGVRGKSGDFAKREGQNVFNIQAGVAITILVKNPKVKRNKAEISYHDIGDYLTREQKLEIIKESESIFNPKFTTEIITPNEHGDWLNQRNDTFNHFIALGDKENRRNTNSFFGSCYSNGIKTQRDIWCYNYSKTALSSNMKKCIVFYNIEIERTNKNSAEIDCSADKISWTRALKNNLERGNKSKFNELFIVTSTYRPFCNEFLYFTKKWNEEIGKMKNIFPDSLSNICIAIPGKGSLKQFYPFIFNKIPSYDAIEKGQCFPLYWYERVEHKQRGFFDTQDSDYVRHDGITDFILEQARQIDFKITKEDIFYYVYGFLHLPAYRETFAADLKKMLPRIPLVENPAEFWAFSKAGRDLADLHLNYETVAPCPDVVVAGAEHGNFHVEKMRFKSKGDKSTIVFNPYITVSNIPLKAYDYVVNGRSAIEWVMERYQIKTDKDSGITNDPNDWASEHNQSRYILDLLLSVITVSLKSLDIIGSLPKFDFLEKKPE